MQFMTSDGVVYAVDTINHYIQGGIFVMPTQYLSLCAMLGDEAYITLMDGSYRYLGLVVSY